MASAKNEFPKKGDTLWLNVNLATMTEGSPYGMVEDGVLVVGGSKIVWLGKRVDLPADYESRVEKAYDGQGGWVTPGGMIITNLVLVNWIIFSIRIMLLNWEITLC